MSSRWPKWAGSTSRHSINENATQKITVPAMTPEHDAYRANGEQQGYERHRRRQHAENDRHEHPLRTPSMAPASWPAPLAMGDVDALADNHGIVHQQAEREDESNDRGGIHRVAERVDEEDGPQERDGDPEGHPKRQMWPQRTRRAGSGSAADPGTPLSRSAPSRTDSRVDSSFQIDNSTPSG